MGCGIRSRASQILAQMYMWLHVWQRHAATQAHGRGDDWRPRTCTVRQGHHIVNNHPTFQLQDPTVQGLYTSHIVVDVQIW
jgi:hypothetical protein